MRTSTSIVPDALGQDIYPVLDNFGGLAWPDADVTHADRATLIRHLLEGQCSSPVCVVAFNTAEGWSRDVTEEIAAEQAKHAPIVTRSPHRLRTSLSTTPGLAKCAYWQFGAAKKRPQLGGYWGQGTGLHLTSR
jgi:hypothetical protein